MAQPVEPVIALSPRLRGLVKFDVKDPPELDIADDATVSSSMSFPDYVKKMGGSTPISRILIANNGIAAVKAIFSIKKWAYETLGSDKVIEFVAMATPEDLKANAEYIHIADEFIAVPGGSNNNNYANVMLITEIAETTRCHAVWAGWGHASENPRLPDALALTKSKIVWIGPPAHAMRALGDKIGSTLIAQSAGVPCMRWSGDGLKVNYAVDGIPTDTYNKSCIFSAKQAVEVARTIGFPVMIKASEGGGGKGIRRVENAEQMEAAFRQVQGEVPGSPIFIMKLAGSCRHLEVQLLCDTWGNAIAIFGRDCSIQRRHQKIIEEGPVVAAPPHIWREMERSAVRLAKEVGYVGAGTVEYLYMEDGSYCFLELNPRLQVEHPVTEFISGVNLPAAQLQVAMGIPLHHIRGIRRMFGEDVRATSPIDFDNRVATTLPGHVIACRITAENPDEKFQPTSGVIQELHFRTTPDVWGYFSVGPKGGVHEFADSQFGHMFALGATREVARKNMVLALKELAIRGDIRTTVEYLRVILEAEDFKKNQISTTWLERVMMSRAIATEKPEPHLAVICGALFRAQASSALRESEYQACLMRGQLPSPKLYSALIQSDVELIYEGLKYNFHVSKSGPNSFDLAINGWLASADVHTLSDGGLLVLLDGKKLIVYGREFPSGLRLTVDLKTCLFHEEYDPTQMRSAMQGKLVQWLVQDGAHVNKGQAVGEVEVMKMYVSTTAPEAGVIRLLKPEGTVMEAGDLIATLSLDDPDCVQKAETFSGQFPAMRETSLVGTKPNARLRHAESKLRMLLAGYELGPGVLHTAILTALECLRDPMLPVVQFIELASTLTGRLPAALLDAMHDIVRRYEQSILEKRFPWEAPPAFPATLIEHTIEQFLLSLTASTAAAAAAAAGPGVSAAAAAAAAGDPARPIRSSLEASGLLPLTRQYKPGNHSYAVSLIKGLLLEYLSVEEHFQSNASPEAVINQLRKTHRNDLQRVAHVARAHHQLVQRNELVLRLLNIIVDQMTPLLGDFLPLLQRFASLRGKASAGIVLRARQLLMSQELPSVNERVIAIETVLTSVATSKTLAPHARLLRLGPLIDQSQPIEDLIFGFFRHTSAAFRNVAIEVYIRRVFQLFTISRLEVFGAVNVGSAGADGEGAEALLMSPNGFDDGGTSVSSALTCSSGGALGSADGLGGDAAGARDEYRSHPSGALLCARWEFFMDSRRPGLDDFTHYPNSMSAAEAEAARRDPTAQSADDGFVLLPSSLAAAGSLSQSSGGASGSGAARASAKRRQSKAGGADGADLPPLGARRPSSGASAPASAAAPHKGEGGSDGASAASGPLLPPSRKAAEFRLGRVDSLLNLEAMHADEDSNAETPSVDTGASTPARRAGGGADDVAISEQGVSEGAPSDAEAGAEEEDAADAESESAASTDSSDIIKRLGVMAHFADVGSLKRGFSTLLGEFDSAPTNAASRRARRLSGVPVHVVYIYCCWPLPPPSAGTPQAFEFSASAGTPQARSGSGLGGAQASAMPADSEISSTFRALLSAHTDELRDRAVRRVTFVVSSGNRAEEHPGYFTFRHNSGYDEDKSIRHIEPNYALHMQLHRLALFDFEFMPTTNRMVHLFAATPKAASAAQASAKQAASPSKAVGSGSAAAASAGAATTPTADKAAAKSGGGGGGGSEKYDGRRFFVRVLVRRLDSAVIYQPNKRGHSLDAHPETEIAFVEALNSLEIAQANSVLPQAGGGKKSGQGLKWLFNHVFVNVLVEVVLYDIHYIEAVIRALTRRYADKIRRLHVTYVEFAMSVRASSSSAKGTPCRFICSNPTGYILDVDAYEERVNPLSGRVSLVPLSLNASSLVDSSGLGAAGGDSGAGSPAAPSAYLDADAPYPVSRPFDSARLAAAAMETVWCYDFIPVIEKAVRREWRRHLVALLTELAADALAPAAPAGNSAAHSGTAASPGGGLSFSPGAPAHVSASVAFLQLLFARLAAGPKSTLEDIQQAPLTKFRSFGIALLSAAGVALPPAPEDASASATASSGSPLLGAALARAGVSIEALRDLFKKLSPSAAQQALAFARASASLPKTFLRAHELVLDPAAPADAPRLVESSRPAGQNNVGMVAWRMTMHTPEAPAGRDVVVIANDITHMAGSFGPKEDTVFDLASKRARALKIPRVYLAANSGARIGLAEELRTRFKVAWVGDNPARGFQYLYLTPADYAELKDSVMCSKIEVTLDSHGGRASPTPSPAASAAPSTPSAAGSAPGPSLPALAPAHGAAARSAPGASTPPPRSSPAEAGGAGASSGESETRYVLTDIVGRKDGLGVENLRGSGLIAGETSLAYEEIFTLTFVTGRTVGIGAYLARLGQRVIQKTDPPQPLILTGYNALNKLLGRTVYTSNVQLGGPDIMYTNGVSHLAVPTDLDGCIAIVRWLSYVPVARGAPLPVLGQSLDPVDRAIDFKIPRTPYDPRHMLAGVATPGGSKAAPRAAAAPTPAAAQQGAPASGRELLPAAAGSPAPPGSALAGGSGALPSLPAAVLAHLGAGFQRGFFDKDSWMEVLGGWARGVAVGRARLGGIPVGVVAVETRTIEQTAPADPAGGPESKEQVVARAGQVWYPDSAFKTAQAIRDLAGEDLPVFIFANWRGFSGGMRDMFEEVLKYGSYIVDALRAHSQPVLVYIPRYGTLRGGAWVVVDPTINEDWMEMYADNESRGGILEPEGTVDVKFRRDDIVALMHKTDPALQELDRDAEADPARAATVKPAIKQREGQLYPVFHQVATAFADLHDTPGRMLRKGCISEIVPWEGARQRFYWRLALRVEEGRHIRALRTRAGVATVKVARSLLHAWLPAPDNGGASAAVGADLPFAADKARLELMRKSEDVIEGKIVELVAAAARSALRESVQVSASNPAALSMLFKGLSGEELAKLQTALDEARK